jgi:hypothetical protein
MDISSFVSKHRKKIKEITIEEKIDSLPWYKKPIDKNHFSYKKGKDGKYYVTHNEWSKHTWIGPYNTIQDAHNVIKEYESLSNEEPLNRLNIKTHIHSVYIDEPKEFF